MIILAIKRLLAYWIDFLIAAVVLIGAQVVLYYATGGYPFERFVYGFQIELWVLLTFSLPVWLYFIFAEYLYQRTIGKRLLKLEVYDVGGGRLRLGQTMKRTLVRLLPWELSHLIILVPKPWWGGGAPENFGLIWIPNALLLLYIVLLFLGRGRRGIHDYVASTAVRPRA